MSETKAPILPKKSKKKKKKAKAKQSKAKQRSAVWAQFSGGVRCAQFVFFTHS